MLNIYLTLSIGGKFVFVALDKKKGGQGGHILPDQLGKRVRPNKTLEPVLNGIRNHIKIFPEHRKSL